MLDNKFASFEDNIKKKKDDKIITIENKMDIMENRLQVLVKAKKPNNQLNKGM